jgi:hypothetical protein
MSTATAQETNSETTREAGPSPILRGWRANAGTTVLLFAHEPGAKTHGHGFINTGTGNRNVIMFFNDRDGKKSITLKEFVPGEGDDGGKWNVVGFGNAMNQRKDGKPVFFDTVLFSVGDQTLEARTTRAGEAFRHAMGFTAARIERPKEDKAGAAAQGNAATDGDAFEEPQASKQERARGG